MTKAVEKIRELRAAQDIRGVLGVDLPVTVHILERPEAFNSAATMALSYSSRKLRPNESGIYVDTHETEDPFSSGFTECLDATKQTEEAALLDRDSGILTSNFKIEARGWLYGVVQNTASGIHPDHANSPRSRTYACSTKAPTLIVPNHVALEIMQKFPVAQTLDWNISENPEDNMDFYRIFGNLTDPNATSLLEGETQADRHAFIDALKNALEPAESSAVTMMSGLTFHTQQDEDQKDRIFFHAFAHG